MSDAADSSSKSISVMVVDDSNVQRQFAVDLCLAQGWSVVDTASDGMEALLKLKKNGAEHLDLLLLDLEMPGLNGIDLLQELARLHLNMSILILSSRELSLIESVGQMAQQSGLNVIQVVQKPLRAEDLQALNISRTYASAPQLEISREELLDAIPTFQTLYLPCVSLDTGFIHHLAAKLTWQHPQQGLLFPSTYAMAWQAEKEFLRAMAQHQKTVFTQIQNWSTCGLSLAVQIELPLHNIQTPLHARTILNEAQQLGITASKLSFEIPIISDNPQELVNSVGALNLLRIQNIGLALCEHTLDFEWVRHMRNIPFSQLTLSDKLLKKRSQDQFIPIFCQHSIALAHDLNMTIHAEGLETLDDWKYLYQLHCNTAQGPFIGSILSADNVFPWIKVNQSVLRSLAEEVKETRGL